MASVTLFLAASGGPVLADDDYVVKDTFNLDPPNTALPVHRLEIDEVGGGWLQGVGSDFRITSDGLAVSDSALNASPGIAVIDTLVSEFDLSVSVGRDDGASVTGVVFRYLDAENHLRAVHDGREARLEKVVDGVVTSLDERRVKPPKVGSLLWVVQVRSESVTVFADGKRVLESDDASFAESTQAGLIHQSVQSTSFRDFRIESDDDPVSPPPPPEPSEPVVADSFTAPDGTVLPLHTGTEKTSGGGWNAVSGDWEITEGEARLLVPDPARPFADQVAVIPAEGVEDAWIAADITWSGGTTGLTWDTQDAANYSLVFWDGSFLVVGFVDSGIFHERGRQRISWAAGETRNLGIQLNDGIGRVRLDGGAPVLIAPGLPALAVQNAGIFVRADAGNSFDNFTVRHSDPVPALPPPADDDPSPPVEPTVPPVEAWVFDSFDAPDATLLRHRTPEIDPAGVGWSEETGFWQTWQALASEQTGVFGPSGHDRFAMVDAGVDEYELEVEIDWDGGRVGVLFGGTATGPDDVGRNTFIFFRTGDRLELGHLTGGIYSRIESTGRFNWKTGQRRTMKVEIEDGEAELKLDGRKIFEFSDGSLDGATWAGLFQRGRNDERFNDFTVHLPEGVEPPPEPAIGPIPDVEMAVGDVLAVPIPLTLPAGSTADVTASASRVPNGPVVLDDFSGEVPSAMSLASHVPGAAPAGVRWKQVRPGVAATIVNGTLHLPVGGDGGDQRVVIDTGYPDSEITAEVTGIAGKFGLVARHDGLTEDANWVMGWVDAEFGVAFVARRSNGEFKVLGQRSYTWPAGASRSMTLRVVGDQAVLSIDGTELMSAKVDGPLAGTHVGLFAQKIGADGLFKSFEVTGMGLPDFIELDTDDPAAPQLVLSPRERDSGEYLVTLDATHEDGILSTSFHLTVASAGDGGPDGPVVALAAMATAGDAIVEGETVLLTPDALWQGGAAWMPEPVDITSGFTASFELDVFSSSPPGADGLAFVVQNSQAGRGAIGLPGSALGYSLIENSVAVEFDTWVNPEFGETGAHVAVHSNGTNPNSSSDATRLSMTDVEGLGETPVVRGRIEYMPGQLKVFVAGMESPVLELAIDLSAMLDLPDGMAFVGFTASTGGASQTHRLRSFTFAPLEQ